MLLLQWINIQTLENCYMYYGVQQIINSMFADDS
jgi:hypothetical protein